jgi:hypothetical protein
MPELSLTDLNRIARQADLEVRVEGEAIQTKEGSWGGRVMRGLKVGVLAGVVAEDRTAKREGYGQAKNAVLQALKKEYGDDIGERAFLKGAGRLKDGKVWSSSDHPLTGRQIRLMIEHAEAARDHRLGMTKDRLEALALTGDRELTGGVVGVVSQAGGVGGRVARGFKIAFGPEGAREHRTEYHEAKNQVMQALKRAYGDDLAERAFLAGAGRRNEAGRVESSRDHPLTGDHVRKMLDHARSEAARFDAKQPRLDLGSDGWARERSGLAEGKLELGEALVEIERSPLEGTLPVAELADRLLQEIEDRPRERGAPQHLFWSVGLGDRGSLTIHLDRENPEFVRVLDPGRRDAKVPRAELAGWLAAHLGDAHGEAVREASLHRAEQRLDGLYDLRGGQWVADQEARAGGAIFAEQAKEAIGGQRIRETLGTPLSSNFVKDVDRATVLVVPPGGRPERLTSETAVDGLKTLVGSGDPGRDAIAMQNLSKLLNQELPKASLDVMMPELAGQGRQLLTHQGMENLHITASRIESGGGPAIEITYRDGKQLGWLSEADGVSGRTLDPRTDTLRSEVVLRVPLATLQNADWDGTLPQRPTATARLHLERAPGRDPEPGDLPEPLTFIPGRDGVLRAELPIEHRAALRLQDQQRVGGTDDLGSLADELRRDKATLEVGGEPIVFSERALDPVGAGLKDKLGLDRNDAGQLHRLLATDALRGTRDGALAALGLDEWALAEREVQVTRGKRNGVDCLEIDIAWGIKNSAIESSSRSLSHWGEPPQDYAEHVIAVRLSVPLEALQKEEPGRFVVLGGPTLERRPLG